MEKSESAALPERWALAILETPGQNRSNGVNRNPLRCLVW